MDALELSSKNKQMRIMHIASGDLWAGAEVQLFTLVKSLAQYPPNVLNVVLMNEGELASRLRNWGVEVTVIDEAKNTNLGILLQLRDVISGYKPDVIHTHRTKENILGAVANALSCRAYSVRTVHGAPEFSDSSFRQAAKWLVAKVDQYVGRYAQNRVIAVSDELGLKMLALYPAGHIAVVLNGVDVDALSNIKPSELLSNKGEVKHIGIVGRLVAVKRVDLFLDTCRALLSRGENKYHFHIIGDGPLKLQLLQQSKRLGVDTAVTFHGHRDDVANFIKGLDLLVMCSDHEGLPMTALESVALGTPIVAHAVGGLVALLENSKCSSLVSEHAVAGYEKAIFNSCAKLTELRAVEALPELYTAQRNAKEMMRIYSEGVIS
jgi:glycosyltransferase involved in cell wall biosynthesis